MTVPRPAVFLDRDGVLNQALVVAGRPHPPRSRREMRMVPGAQVACRRLGREGLGLVMVTNQPDLARGTLNREVVDAINASLTARLGLDLVMVCPHDDSDRCSCRKPAPGLLLEASRLMNIDLRRSVMVGDRWRDVEAGRAAGCATVLVERDYEMERRARGADLTVGSLAEAVPWILRICGTDRGIEA